MSKIKHGKDKTEKTGAEEEASKMSGQTSNETLFAQTFEEYHCSGNVEIDFPGLCILLDIKDIPAVKVKHPVSSASDITTDVEDAEDTQCQIKAAYKPCLQVELENENVISAKSMRVAGLNVDEQIYRVLEKMLPSLSKLQSLQFWQARLTDQMVISLVKTISLCSSLRVVSLEGNPLPKQSYHLLLSEDSVITHLSLRNNQMGDEGACLIGSALSTPRSANKHLLSLNLAFNSVGDAGAAHIAQGLRLNHTLLVLSLSNNHIGDSGAAHLAAILCEFALTHEEVVERRKLLLEKSRLQSSVRVDSNHVPPDHLPSVSSSTSLNIGKGGNKSTSKKKEETKKDEKPVATKENAKLIKKTSDVKTPQNKDGKSKTKEKHEGQSSPVLREQGEVVEIVNPLLGQSVEYRDGQLFLPGNKTLVSLNLAGNRITEKSLPLFLATLNTQDEEGGLLRLCLQRNRFPPECDSYLKIRELMELTDPLEMKTPDPT